MTNASHLADEARISNLLQGFARAFRARDVAGVMSLFAADVVSFDLAPPLRCIGADALRQHWEATFSSFRGDVAYEIHELTIVVDGDLAISHSLNWMRATVADGQVSERWLRWTACFRRTGQQWQVTHEHVSVPIDVASGKARIHLTP